MNMRTWYETDPQNKLSYDQTISVNRATFLWLDEDRLNYYASVEETDFVLDNTSSFSFYKLMFLPGS